MLIKESISGQSRLTSLQDTKVAFEEVNKDKEKNYLNTVTTMAPDSTEYELVAIGESRPEFFINNELVHPDEMEKYAALIHQMKKQFKWC